MKTLHLNLKRGWFDLILSGEKKEEYRDLTEYWEKRLVDNSCFLSDQCAEWKDFESITFSNGYSKKRDQFEIELIDIEIGVGLAEWGAKKGKEYFVLELGNIINSNCT